jgi:hypothetical protein
LAITPQNNEAFFREVDDEVRRDRVENAARRYGVIAAIVVLIGLAVFGGTLAWRSHQQTVSGEQGEKLVAAMSALSAGQDDVAAKGLKTIVDAGTKGYAPLARLLQADLLVKQEKMADASAAFARIAGDASVPQELRDVALLRGTTIDFDKLPPAEVVTRLKPLAVPGNPWFGSAGEITGIAYMKLNQPKLAGPLFVAITKDKTAPRSVRARVSQLASDLGFEPVQTSDSADS